MRVAITVILVTSLFSSISSVQGIYNCTKKPQLTTIVTTPKGQLRYYNDIVSITESASVEIRCLSSEPLQMEFKGEMAQRFDDIVKKRHVKKDSPDFCFEAVLKFESQTSATGNYTCETITNSAELTTSVYIFADDGQLKNGQLLNAGKCISTGGEVPDNFSLIIPCLVSNRNSKPKLYRSNYEKCEDIRKHHEDETMEQKTFLYDPKRGFIIDTQKTNDCWTNFVCVLGSQTLGVKTIKPEEFRSTPREGTIVYHQKPHLAVANYMNYFKITLSCESTQNITFVHTFKDANSTVMKPSEKHPEKYYAYKATLRYTGTFQYADDTPTSTVSCVKVKNPNFVYKKWTIVHKDHEDKTGLFFDDKSESYFCYSATAGPTIPTLTLINCYNSLECTIAQTFIQKNMTNEKDFPFKVTDVGYSCRNQPATIYSGCKEFPIQIGERYGMAHCKTGDYHYFSIYYTNLLGDIVTLYSSLHSHFIILEKVDRTVFVNETVNFTCKASSLQFSLGIRIAAITCPEMESTLESCLIYDYDFPKNATFVAKEIIENGVIIYTVAMNIWTSRITRILCDVPVLTSKGWQNASQSLSVKDGQYPEIKNDVPQSLKLENIENDNFTCTALGEPLPQITWERNGSPIQQNHYDTQTLDNMTVSTLIFQTLSPVTPGEYSCIATNAKGSTKKSFEIETDKISSLFTHAIIAGTVAAILLLFLLILIGILRRQKKAIDKLTEAEIAEFEKGNETMVHHSSELSEIAQYLPYNLDFEIPEKNLELIDEDLLGSGAFGVVLKGYVEENGEKYAVAIKTIKSTNNVDQLKKLLVELKIMMHIGRHLNIIYLIGAQTRKLREGKVRVIVEYCAFGNLQTFLRENRADFVNQVVNDQIDEWIMPRSKTMKQNRNAITKLPECPIVYQSKRFSQQSPAIRTLDLVNWCYQLANGMEYLEMKKVIHGDLATRNLLLTEDWTLKITDFGLSRRIYEYTNYVRKEKIEPLPWRWLSVEAIKDSKFSTMSDVWAFGITIWEIFSLAEVPYPGFSWGEEFVIALSKGYRLSKPQHATTDVYNKMKECWSHELTDRPTFKVLKEYFQQILETYSNSTEKILEAFLGPDSFNFESKSVQTSEDINLS